MRSLLAVVTVAALGWPQGRAIADTPVPITSASANLATPVYLTGVADSYPPASEQAWPPASAEPLPPTEPATGPSQNWFTRLAQQPAEMFRSLSSPYSNPAAGNCFGPVCDDCPTHAIQVLIGYDSFRGITDDSWQNNGIHTGFNYGTRLGQISEWTGIGGQIGGTVNIYDWSGTDYRPNTSSATTQGFITYGLFKRPNAYSNWSAAIAQDWMITNNYGEYSTSPTMSQGRYQLGYATSARNEYGFWGTAAFYSQTKNIPGVGSTYFRPIDQFNLYWKYKWAPGGADTQLWIGTPLADRFGTGGTLGSWLVGASANVPLNDRVALYTLVTYMRPAASAGPVASTEDSWNFTIGLAFYPQRNARSSTVAGQCWMPLLPVANNGYFLVNTNHH